jgi:hypothetical protein
MAGARMAAALGRADARRPESKFKSTTLMKIAQTTIPLI